MKNDKVIGLGSPAEATIKNTLEAIAREGARKMLQAALEAEVEGFLLGHAQIKDEQGRQAVVRNGKGHARKLQTGIGEIELRVPRVRRRDGGERYSSAILPPFMRRSTSIDNLIPALYLKGVSTGDFGEALEAILGEDATGLSATNITRLKNVWEKEFEQWRQRDLSQKNYVYWWVDGVHFNVRLEDERSCILVIMGATEDGNKELIAVSDGFRESKESWRELLRDLKNRGLQRSPKIAIGDGAMGFWAALEEEFGDARQQRCWVHKTANVLDKMPKSIQSKAKQKIHDIYLAPTRKEAYKAFDHFIDCYQAKYPKATDCLIKDKEQLMSFYDFPAEHWSHLRTTNPIESTFATVRHRQRKTKGCGTRAATLSMVFKLSKEAEKCWRRLNGHQQIPKIIRGVIFVDGEEVLDHKLTKVA